MSVNIQLEWTPNPSTLKYVVDRRLLSGGAVNFTQREEAEKKSPLARKLMDVKGVTAVMVGLNFVTVTKGEEGEWDELNDAVMATLDSHLEANEPVVDEAAVAQDGGDITLDRFENGIAYVHMKGSCSGCPSSTATLKMGIESRLRESIPEVLEVVSV